MIDTIILLHTFNEPQLLIWRGRGHKRAAVGLGKGGGRFLQALAMKSRQEQGRAGNRLTLKSLRASV